MNSLINKQYKFTYMVRRAIANTVEVIIKKKTYLYIYKTETFEVLTIFHDSTILFKLN